MSQENMKKGEILYKAAYEENSREKPDLYLLTMDMIAKKISFEEWIRRTILWARDVMQPDTQGNEEP